VTDFSEQLAWLRRDPKLSEVSHQRAELVYVNPPLSFLDHGEHELGDARLSSELCL
jgi:hypothetical protein